MSNFVDLRIRYRNGSTRIVRNTTNHEINLCADVPYFQVTYEPCGPDCKDDECPCYDRNLYIAPDLIAEVEEFGYEEIAKEAQENT